MQKKITVYHATAPTCWWSWGYESTLNRLRLVYGDKIQIRLILGTVYEDLTDWMKQYELTKPSWKSWAEESAELMGIPIRTDYDPASEPRTVLPATYAVLAAEKQGSAKGARFMRAVLRMFVVEGRDVTQKGPIADAVVEAGLDVQAFEKDFGDTKARKRDLDRQGEGFPHLPLGFYNLAVSDESGRTVLIDNAFEPGLAEGTIDYLSGGSIDKMKPANIVEYLNQHDLASTTEVARVFAIKTKEAETKLEGLLKQGRVEKKIIIGKSHWRAAPGK